MQKAVIGTLTSRSQAELVVADLKNSGFSTNDISVLFPDQTGTRDFAYEQNTKAPEGAAAGGAAGGALGGTLGLLVGIGALAIPGLGMFIAAGPIMAALSGAAVGAAVGGVGGALIGLGIPEFEAKAYEGKLKSGAILIAVHTENSDSVTLAKAVFERGGAKDIASTGEASVPNKIETAPVARPY